MSLSPCLANSASKKHLSPMSTVTEIIEAVKRLGEDQRGEFLDRLLELHLEDAWDRQMEADAKAGKLDFLVREADEALRADTLRDWPDTGNR